MVVNQPMVRDRSVPGSWSVFAAVAFEVDQDLVVAGPAAQGAGQRGEQDVVDLGAVGGGYLVQQGAGRGPG